LFVRGTDNGIYHKWWDGAHWGPSPTDWESLGGATPGPVTAVAWGANRLDLFVRGTDNGIYHKWWDGAHWGPSPTDWESLGGATPDEIGAVAWGANRLDLFVRGTDNGIYHKWWDGAHWGPSPTISAPTSIVLNSNININGPENGNIAGALSLTINSDGSYVFSGHLNNSNWTPNNVIVVFVIASTRGTAFTFSVSSQIDAALPWDNNNWSWNKTGNNAAIKNSWSEFQSGYKGQGDASASLAVGPIVNSIESAISTALGVTLDVISVVA
jgi:hypothetical protein